jgi:hypothetical protein
MTTVRVAIIGQIGAGKTELLNSAELAGLRVFREYIIDPQLQRYLEQRETVAGVAASFQESMALGAIVRSKVWAAIVGSSPLSPSIPTCL